jgi:hypothetical protein
MEDKETGADLNSIICCDQANYIEVYEWFFLQFMTHQNEFILFSILSQRDDKIRKILIKEDVIAEKLTLSWFFLLEDFIMIYLSAWD